MPSLTLTDLEAKYFPPGSFIGTPHSKDTEVVPHVDGEGYFKAIADAIDQCSTGAGDRIYISSWWLDTSFSLPSASGAKLLIDLLLEKAALGVDVRVIVWTGRFFTGKIESPDDVGWWPGTMLADQEALKGFVNVVVNNMFAAINLRAAKALPLGTTPLDGRVLMDWGCSSGGSRHEKSTVVYSVLTSELRAFVGGMDYQPARMADELHTVSGWHDAGVELRGGAAEAVLGNFRTRWEETRTLPKRRYKISGISGEFEFNPKIEPTPPTLPGSSKAFTSGLSIRVLRSYGSNRSYRLFGEGPDIEWETLLPEGVQELKRVVQNALDVATRYIYVEDQGLNPAPLLLPGSVPYTPAPHTLLFPKISQACARGVKVIFICPGETDPADNTVALTTMSEEIKRLILDPLTHAQKTNFALYVVAGTVVHSKVILVDDEIAVIGSGNFMDRSMEGDDTEVSAAIVDPGPLIRDLRVRLWRGHLRVTSSPVVDAELSDLTKSLGLFNTSWGSGITFSHPHTMLAEIKK